jgi:hypothetical protein
MASTNSFMGPPPFARISSQQEFSLAPVSSHLQEGSAMGTL